MEWNEIITFFLGPLNLIDGASDAISKVVGAININLLTIISSFLIGLVVVRIVFKLL